MSPKEMTDLFLNLLTLAGLCFLFYFLYVDLIGRRKK